MLIISEIVGETEAITLMKIRYSLKMASVFLNAVRWNTMCTMIFAPRVYAIDRPKYLGRGYRPVCVEALV